MPSMQTVVKQALVTLAVMVAVSFLAQRSPAVASVVTGAAVA